MACASQQKKLMPSDLYKESSTNHLPPTTYHKTPTTKYLLPFKNNQPFAPNVFTNIHKTFLNNSALESPKRGYP
jgi:hypothetical protein